MNCDHTPRPWKWHWRHEDGEANGSVFAEPRLGHAYAVAMCPRYQTQERWTADAHLIAAAPDMLEALQRLVEVHRQQDTCGVLPADKAIAYGRAEAAIAKAASSNGG